MLTVPPQKDSKAGVSNALPLSEAKDCGWDGVHILNSKHVKIKKE